MRTSTKLRQLLQRSDGCVIMGGAHDCMSACIAQSAGALALSVGGLGVEASMLGNPDIGLITMSEMVNQVSRIASAIDIPIVADCDTGFGTVMHVTRMVRELERAGAAGFHIEDQMSPKKCPILGGIVVAPVEEMVAKIQAAAAARTDPDLVIVARCDADYVSFDEQVSRMNAYLKAGADMVMPGGTRWAYKGDAYLRDYTPAEQMRLNQSFTRAIDGPVLGVGDVMLGIDYGGNVQRWATEAGYKLYMLPLIGLQATVNTLRAVWKEALVDGNASGYFARNPTTNTVLRDLFGTLGLSRWLEVEKRFGGQ